MKHFFVEGGGVRKVQKFGNLCCNHNALQCKRLLTHCTEVRGEEVSTPDSYSGEPWFKPRPAGCTGCCFSWFILSPSCKML
jgi:hypothetical protein